MSTDHVPMQTPEEAAPWHPDGMTQEDRAQTLQAIAQVQRTGAVLDALHEQVIKARLKHAVGIRSAHEGIAVIHEEFLEARTEVYKQVPDPAHLLKELMHTAAMCVRMIEDLGLDGGAPYKG